MDEMTKEAQLIEYAYKVMRDLADFYGKDWNQLNFELEAAVDLDDYEFLRKVAKDLEDNFDIEDAREFFLKYELAKRLKDRIWGKIDGIKVPPTYVRKINKI